jgi:hypothetical protein
VLAVFGLHFNHTWDLTAAGTLALALLTLITLIVNGFALRQTRRAIQLSRQEVEEAHRPVLVPLADSRPIDITGYSGVGRASAQPAVPGESQLTVPIENIGTGPALRVEATVELLNDEGGPSAAGTGGMTLALLTGVKASGSVVPLIRVHGLAGLTSFWLTLTYEDVAGKGWITKARYIKTLSRYEDLTVNTLDEGAYGLRKDSELLKPVA